jgi:hypothetical protein
MSTQRIVRWLRQLCSLRTAGFTVVAVLLIAAGVATASIIQPGAGTDGMFGPDSFAWDGTPASVPVTVADPGGQERWAVRVYRSKDGFPCLEAGRLRGGDAVADDFGRVDGDGTFKALPIGDGGSPVDLSESSYALLVNRYRATETQAAQAAIFGMVPSEVQAVVLHRGSQTTTVAVRGGVFLAVVPESELADAGVQFVKSDGSSKTVELRAKPPAGSGVAPMEP